MRISAVAGVLSLIMAAGDGLAAAPASREQSAEDWAWTQLRNDQVADFNTREGCNGQLVPYQKTKAWDAACRQISPQFIVQILTRREWLDQLPRLRVRLRGAHITGSVNLSDAEIRPEVWIDDSRIEGDLLFDDTRWDHLLSLQGSTVGGGVWAWRMQAASNVALDHRAIVFGSVNLGGARIAGDLQMDGSGFAHDVNAGAMNITGSLFMRQAVFDGQVNLIGSKIDGELGLLGSTFKKGFDGNRLDVEGSLFMSRGATFTGHVDLVGATIGSNFEMDDAVFSGSVSADALKVTQDLQMGGAHLHDQFRLVGATVGGALDMTGAEFDGPVMADRLKVTGSLFMRMGATFRAPISLIAAKIGSNLDLRGAVASSIDLSEGDAAEFLVSGLKWWCAGGRTPNASPAGSIAGDDQLPVFWPLGNQFWPQARCKGGTVADPPKLILRNFHVAEFQDDANAWPPELDLMGFHYDRLGGLGGGGKDDPGRRPDSAWQDWLARDRDFSTQPYTELSSVFAIAGQRDIADAIQFSARDGERREACASDHWQKCAWLSVLSAIAGYGIGSYTFRVLYWVLFFTAVGTVVLCFSPKARRHTLVWRAGASLHRLLPIIELYKEFKDFFENPQPTGFASRNLKSWQAIYFAVHAIVGWALGLILLAAMSGLTQKG